MGSSRIRARLDTASPFAFRSTFSRITRVRSHQKYRNSMGAWSGCGFQHMYRTEWNDRVPEVFVPILRHITSFHHIRNSKLPLQMVRMWVSTHVTTRMEWRVCRRYSRLFCSHITSFHHIRNSKLPLQMVRMWVSTHVTKRMEWPPAGIRASFAVTLDITSIHHIRNSKPQLHMVRMWASTHTTK